MSYVTGLRSMQLALERQCVLVREALGRQQGVDAARFLDKLVRYYAKQGRELDRSAVGQSFRAEFDELLCGFDASDEAVGILSYFVNELRLADKSTPYSIVAALGRSDSIFTSIMTKIQLICIG